MIIAFVITDFIKQLSPDKTGRMRRHKSETEERRFKYGKYNDK
jgi:hypothetical protein